MAAEERVIIKVEIDSDISNDLLGIERRLKRLEDRQGRLHKDTDRHLRDTDRTMRRLDRSTGKVNNRFSHTRRAFQSILGPLQKFTMLISKIGFVALAGQIGLFTAALVGVKVALLAGRGAVSLYNMALKGLSVGAVSVASGLAVAAAAMRQFTEAQLAANFSNNMKNLGRPGGINRGGMAAAATLSRGVSSTVRGLLGAEATAGIVGALARGGISGNQAGLIRQLYNITGGDAAAAQALAKSLAGKDPKAAIAAIEAAAGFSGDTKALQRSGKSMESLRAGLASGNFTRDGFLNLSEDMAGTFIGTIKTQFAGIKDIFADIGEPMLGPFRDAFIQISTIIKNDLMALTGIIQRFGGDSLAPTLVTIVDKISEFIRSNIVDNIENVKEMGESFIGFFRGVRSFFDSVGAALRAMEPAADVVIDMFRAMGGAAGGRGLFKDFRDLIVSNADAFTGFGESIGNVIGAVFDLLKGGQVGFFANLDRISETINRIGDELVPAIGEILNALTPLLEKIPDVVSMLARGLSAIAGPLKVLAEILAAIVGLLAGSGAFGGMAALGMFGFMKGTKRAPRGTRMNMLRNAPGAMAGMFGFGAAPAPGFTAAYREARGYGVPGGMPGPPAPGAPPGSGRLAAGRAAVAARFAGKGMPTLMGALTLGGGLSEQYQSGGSTSGMLMSVGGGAMTGAMLGQSLIPIPVVGAAVGAIVGGLIGGVGAWFAGKKGQEAIANQTAAAFGLYATQTNQLIQSVVNPVAGTEGARIAGSHESMLALRQELSVRQTAFANISDMLLNPSEEMLRSIDLDTTSTWWDDKGRRKEHALARALVGDVKGGNDEIYLENIMQYDSVMQGFIAETNRVIGADRTGGVQRDDLIRPVVEGLMADSNFLAELEKTGMDMAAFEGFNLETKFSFLTGISARTGGAFDPSHLDPASQDAFYKFQAMGEEIEALDERIATFGANLDMLQESFDATTGEIEAVARMLHVDLGSSLLNTAHAVEVFGVALHGAIDRNRFFFGDFAESNLGTREAIATAQAAADTLINAGQGEITAAMAGDFLTSFSIAEVRRGNFDPDVAGLSGILEIFEMIEEGAITGQNAFDLERFASGQAESYLRNMAEQHDISYEALFEAYSGGGTNEQRLDRVSALINDRKMAFDVIDFSNEMSDRERIMQIGRLGDFEGNSLGFNVFKNQEVQGIVAELFGLHNRFQLADGDGVGPSGVLQKLLAGGEVAEAEFARLNSQNGTDVTVEEIISQLAIQGGLGTSDDNEMAKARMAIESLEARFGEEMAKIGDATRTANNVNVGVLRQNAATMTNLDDAIDKLNAVLIVSNLF